MTVHRTARFLLGYSGRHPANLGPIARVAAAGLPLRHTLGIAALIAASTSALASDNAQFLVLELNPEGVIGARASAIGGPGGGPPALKAGGQPVGYVIEGGVRKACEWRTQFHHLPSTGTSDSEATGASGAGVTRQIAGYVTVSGAAHATFWNGSSLLMVPLHPTGASDSHALAVAGGMVVGWATIGGTPNAGWWSGSAGSWINLHPAAATSSQALATDGITQGGWAVVTGNTHASLWGSSTAPWVDLNPTGATNSQVLAIDGALQAGFATFSGVRKAGRWTGLANTWTDLSPVGATDSVATAAELSEQVGYATIGGATHAGIWGATAASWLDLHNLAIPDGFTSSYATGIYHHPAGFLCISGYGFNSNTGQDEPVMWMGRRIPPYANCDNSTTPPILNANDFQCFLNAYAAGLT